MIQILVHLQKGKKVSQTESSPVSGEWGYSCSLLIFSRRRWASLSQHVFHSICPWTLTDGASLCQALMHFTLELTGHKACQVPAKSADIRKIDNKQLVRIINSLKLFLYLQSSAEAVPVQWSQLLSRSWLSLQQRRALNSGKKGPEATNKGMYVRTEGDPFAVCLKLVFENLNLCLNAQTSELMTTNTNINHSKYIYIHTHIIWQSDSAV